MLHAAVTQTINAFAIKISKEMEHSVKVCVCFLCTCFVFVMFFNLACLKRVTLEFPQSKMKFGVFNWLLV